MPTANLLPALEPGPVDLATFESLRSELGSSYARLIFARNFVELLPRRVHRIISALDNNDTNMAMESVLSLKITSAMIGGPIVENRCSQIERAVRAGKFYEARQQNFSLKNETSALGEALTGLLPL
ncbi:Hpt domain-containing protein [Arthrobacter sp. H14]|uniref:Hpt domain-containing protein n=1 Tax=Arthrobacter sp. H14 TaxID=1312959 RepID=UPI0004B51E0C|nr:Hpt domain-containing protein [Arthrobacter sp. H14]